MGRAVLSTLGRATGRAGCTGCSPIAAHKVGEGIGGEVGVRAVGKFQAVALVKVAGTSWAQLKRLDYNEKQVEEICNAIANLDFTKAKPVGPFAMMKQLRDPKVQSALGFMFMLLQTMGSVVMVYQEDKREEARNNA